MVAVKDKKSPKKTKKKGNKKTVKKIPENNPPRKRGRPRKDEQISGSVAVKINKKKLPEVSIESEYLELSEKEERFCREYVCDAALNATKAYMKAFPHVKYSTARCEASKLLAMPNIKARVKEMQVERAARLELTPTRVLNEMAKLAFYDPDSFFDDDGRIKPMSELEPDQRAVIAGLETMHKITGEENDGIAITTKIKLPDKKACLEILLRYMKMLSEGTPAPAKLVGETLKKVASGEMTARDAAYQLQIAGIAIPEILKIELVNEKADGDGLGDGPSEEELNRRFNEGIGAIDHQVKVFVPQRQEEVAELKEAMKSVSSFDPEADDKK